jgi:bacterioferritin (cytochrome b1)
LSHLKSLIGRSTEGRNFETGGKLAMTDELTLLERQPFLTDLEQIQSHTCDYLHQAAAEGGNADADTVIWLLDQVLTLEMVFTLRDIYKSQLAARNHSPQIADELLMQALAGRDHAELAAAQIARLGGEPHGQAQSLPPRYRLRQAEGMSPADMIRENLVGGQIVMEVCREIIRYLGGRAAASRAIIEKILALEEQQTRSLRNLLENISKKELFEREPLHSNAGFEMDSIDVTLDESFPASDPPAWFAGRESHGRKG